MLLIGVLNLSQHIQIQEQQPWGYTSSSSSEGITSSSSEELISSMYILVSVAKDHLLKG